MIFLIIALFLAGLSVLSYYTKLKLHLAFKFSPDRKYIALVMSAAFIRLNEYTFQLQKRKGGLFRLKYYKKGKLQDILELKDLIEAVKRERPKRAKELTEIIDMFTDKRKMVIESLSVRIDVGLEDAMQAGMLHGTVISLLNSALARLYSFKGIPRETKVGIFPYFDKQVFEASIDILFSIKICYLMAAWVKISMEKSKEKKAAKYRRGGSAMDSGRAI